MGGRIKVPRDLVSDERNWPNSQITGAMLVSIAGIAPKKRSYPLLPRGKYYYHLFFPSGKPEAQLGQGVY